MRIRNGNLDQSRIVPCPKCKGKNVMTKGAASCWECRYARFKSAKKYCSKCGIKLTKRNWPRTAKERHHNVCKACFNKLVNEKYLERKDWYKERNQSYKEVVMEHYGGKCSCCGISDLVFLTLDHVNNDGAAHRRSLGYPRHGGGGPSMYKWVIDNDFPKMFQVLCWNCNWSKAHGGCPHQGVVKESKAKRNEKSYKCNKCGKVFKHHGKLANHFRYDHSQVGETHSKRVKVGKASGVKATRSER